MKKITELTDKEILALNSDQLDKMVKYEMAEKGILILEEPKTPNFIEVPDSDFIVYKVNGFSYEFSNKEAAENVAKVIADNKEYLLNLTYNNSDLKHVQQLEKYTLEGFETINIHHAYSKDMIGKVNEIREKNKKLELDYKNRLASYQSEEEKAKPIIDEIYNTHYAVLKKYADMDDLKAKYGYYLALADNNEKTAMNFLKNAYKIDAETEEYVKTGKIKDVLDAKEAQKAASS